MRIVLPILFCLAVLFCGAATATPIGAPLTKEGIAIAPGYDTGMALDRHPSGMGLSPDGVYLTADIRALPGEAHGFPAGAWIPYLDVTFQLTKEGAPAYKKVGILFPAAGHDGPLYANRVDLEGGGVYHLTLIVAPPSSHGLLRRVDKAGGVAAWWKPLIGDWSFTYPAP